MVFKSIGIELNQHWIKKSSASASVSLSNLKNPHLLVNLLIRDIAPKDHAGSEYVVKRCRWLGIVYDRDHFVMVQADFAYIEAPGEEQWRVALGGFAAGPVARVPRVARVALALECALLVYAHLGTRSGVGTLVDVCNKKKHIRFLRISAAIN